jgi:hypothetical protein
LTGGIGGADPDADPDPIYHCDADPDADPDPTYHCDADPDADPDPDFYLIRIFFIRMRIRIQILTSK